MKKPNKNLMVLENKPINELILFAIFVVEEAKESCVFERLLKECFSLFPKAFGFKRYNRWPDARKLDRSLRTLRSKKLISGDPTTFFSLTLQGRKEAEALAKILRQKKLL